jgi:hypothetical protein
MDVPNSLEGVALNTLRKRLTEIFPAQIKECLDKLSDEQIWWKPNDQSNSVGNLILHLSGSIRHYLCHAIGGFEYDRDRPAEFGETGPIPKDALLSTFDETIRQVGATFDSFNPSRLLEPGTQPSYYPTIFDQIYGVSVHLAIHAGQIIYVTKMLQAGAINELWIRVHKLD